MPTSVETGLRNALADAIDTYVSVGSGTATLVFETSGDVEVASCDMSEPAFGAAATGVITADTISDDNHAAGGTAAQVSMYNRAGTKCAEFTLGTSGTEFTISDPVIGVGDTVGVSAFTITIPAA